MEKVHYHKFIFSLFLLQFSSPLLLSSAYTLPDNYFINCGSDSDTAYANRTFIGDKNHQSYFFPGKSKDVKDTSPSAGTIQLYQTARIYRNPSSYKLNIDKNGTYFLRLHFYVFSSSPNLSSALFSVSTSQEPKNLKENSTSSFWLLSNFSVSTSQKPVVKEFLLTINEGKLRIHFIPSGQTSLAFVNAIEVFVAPGSFIDNKAPYITPFGTKGNFSSLLSQVLHTVHRINVGGDAIMPEFDTLLRNWIPDDYFLSSGDAVNDSTNERPRYESGWATEYIAPVHVYKTAKVEESNLTTTWHFDVSKNTTHLVRVHFCDFISPSLNLLRFYLYIYSNFSRLINPYNIPKEYSSEPFYAELATPFYYDFVVDSDDSRVMNISIGLSNESTIKKAFLNGLEIMEFMKESELVPMESETNKGHLVVIVGSVVGGIALICILSVGVVIGLKHRKPKLIQTSDKLSGGGSSYSRTGKSGNSSAVLSLNLKLKKSFSEIQNATENFDKRLIIGEGGFGKVYKGTLSDGTKVAVKRSEGGHGQGLPEFETEIMVLSKIRHRHLVCLIGYCDEGLEMILVYEFMEKGTLREHLYGDSQGSFSQSQLSWDQRLKICIDSAKGLDYLHTGSAGRIIHRDIKSTNILLDENYEAKVADFGLSRSGPPDQTHVSTDVKGTFGYLDPEYFRCYQLTDKSDVYSFGVVLLEVLCARQAIDTSLPKDQVNLAEWGMRWQKEGRLEKIIDPLLVGKINPDSLRKFGETAEKCLKDRGVDRPTMRDVLWELEYALGLQQNTILHREPYEDSTVDASLEAQLPILHRFPSHSITVVEVDKSIVRDDGSDSTASEVFSQLRIDEAR